MLLILQFFIAVHAVFFFRDETSAAMTLYKIYRQFLFAIFADWSILMDHSGTKGTSLGSAFGNYRRKQEYYQYGNRKNKT